MIVRELLTRFGIDFDAKSAQKADTAVGKLKKGAISLAAAFGAGMIGRALVGFVSGMTVAADRVAKTAANIGITSDALQELRYAAELSGVGVGEFDSNMERFVRRLGEAADGTGEAKDAYKDLGIQLKDSSGRTRAAEDVFMDASTAIAGMDDKTRQAAISADLFGRSGIRMLGMLRKGAPGIAAMRKELRDLGGIFGVDLLESSEKYRDELTRLNRLFRGFKIMLMQVLLPAVLTVVGKFIEWGKFISPIIRQSNALQATLIVLGTAFTILAVKMLLPFLPAIAMALGFAVVLGAIILIVGEVITAFKGGETAAVMMDKKIRELAAAPINPEDTWYVKLAKYAAKEWVGFQDRLYEIFDEIWTELEGEGSLIDWWVDKYMVKPFESFVRSTRIRIENFLKWLVDAFKTAGSKLGQYLLPAGLGKTIAKIAAFEIGAKKAAPLLAPAGAGFGLGAPAGLGAAPMLAPGAVGGSASIVNANRIQIDNNITQQPGQSSEELAGMISSNVEDVLKRHISSATAATTPAVAGGG